MNFETWIAWLQGNPDADEATKLAALRRYIATAAKEAVADGNAKAEWVNKKLVRLGITERVGTENAYTIEAPVAGTATLTVYASDRADALAVFASHVGGKIAVAGATTTAAPVFTSGPEDPDPTAFDPQSPTTVDGTLTALREAILLGVIAGPKFCTDGANEALDEFDLDRVPPRQDFVVTRPAEGLFQTTVTAYDEASAQRVAEWRWEDNRSGYTVAEVSDEGDLDVQVKTV